LCQETPSAPDCNLPTYWPAPQMNLSTRAGIHRFSWDMKYEPIGDGGGRGGAAVPRRTYPSVNAPWAPPGAYSVRLTAGGKSYTQPLALHLDPRVNTPAPALTQLTTLTREMYNGARAAHAEAERARALAAALDAAGPDAAALKTEVAALAPPVPAGGGGRGGFGGRGGGRGNTPATLDSASAAMMAAAMAMQQADVAPTARDVEAAAAARRQSTAVMARWTKVTTVDLPALNAKRKAAGQPPIVVPKG